MNGNTKSLYRVFPKQEGGVGGVEGWGLNDTRDRKKNLLKMFESIETNPMKLNDKQREIFKNILNGTKNTSGNKEDKEDKEDYSLCNYIITGIYTSESLFNNSKPTFTADFLIKEINRLYDQHYINKKEYENKIKKKKEEEKKRKEEEKKREEEEKQREEKEKKQELQRQNDVVDYLQRKAEMAQKIQLMIVKVEKKYFVSDYFIAGKPIGGVYVLENDDEFNKLNELTIPQTPSKSTETYKVYLDDKKNTIAVGIVWKSYEINKDDLTTFINGKNKEKDFYKALVPYMSKLKIERLDTKINSKKKK